MNRRELLARRRPALRISSARLRCHFREYAPPELIDMVGEEELEAEEAPSDGPPRHLSVVPLGESPAGHSPGV